MWFPMRNFRPFLFMIGAFIRIKKADMYSWSVPSVNLTDVVINETVPLDIYFNNFTVTRP